MGAPYESLKQVAGDAKQSDTTGDAGDQDYITGRKFARAAGNPMQQSSQAFSKASAVKSIGSMLKAKKKKH